METISEDYVSFEVAKLLKEKGFDVPCLAHWFIGTDRNFSISNTSRNWNEIKTDLDWLSCPTLQMAMRWLREFYDLYIVIDPSNKTPIFAADCFRAKVIDDNLDYRYDKDYIDSYEEAAEVAIKYCLENLI